MKVKFYILFISCLVMASCASNKYADITKVNPDNQITGKGLGKTIQGNSQAEAEHSFQQENAIAAQLSAKDELNTSTADLPHAEENLVALKKESKLEVLKDIATNSDKEIIAIAPQMFQTNTMSAIKEYKQRKGILGFVKNIFKPQVNILLLILAFLIPPLAVGLAVGITGTFWLNLLLTLLFFIPGVIHAIIVVTRET